VKPPLWAALGLNPPPKALGSKLNENGISSLLFLSVHTIEYYDTGKV
jgi:hypothetical protein